VGQKPGFCEIFGNRRRDGKKPGFFDFYCARLARNRVFARYLVTGEEMGKNPVSLIFIVRGGPETGFLREYLVTARDSGKNPVSLDFNRRFPPNA